MKNLPISRLPDLLILPMSGQRTASFSPDSGHPGASFLAKTRQMAVKASIRLAARSCAIVAAAIAGPVSGGIHGGLGAARIIAKNVSDVIRESKWAHMGALLWAVARSSLSTIHGRPRVSISAI